MNKILSTIKSSDIEISDPCKASVDLLLSYNMEHVARHVENVGIKAIELAEEFNEDKNKAMIAGFLHDVSCVIPNEKRIEVAGSFELKLYKEERIFPMIIHQRLSKELAASFFKISDQEILNAISCHTTLRANCTRLDMIVFIADKISWDQPGEPPYLEVIMRGFEESLEKAVYNFVNYLIINKEKMKVVHPWLLEAYYYLKSELRIL